MTNCNEYALTNGLFLSFTKMSAIKLTVQIREANYILLKVVSNLYASSSERFLDPFDEF